MIAGAALDLPTPDDIRNFIHWLGAIGFVLCVVIAFYFGRRS